MGHVYTFDDLIQGASFCLETSQIVFAKSKLCSILMGVLRAEMESTSFKTPRVPEILMFDSYTKGLLRNPLRFHRNHARKKLNF